MEYNVKPRNTIMALIAKNDPGRYYTRSVEDENQKIKTNRSRRLSQERSEIEESAEEYYSSEEYS